jgi:inhibitor of cysteine peptidase
MDAHPIERRSTRVGEPFTIRLAVNPTTGFGWQAIYDSQSIALVDRKFELGSGSVGGGGEEVLTFRCLHPGRIVLTLELRRPWEKNAGARESRAYEISVEP